MAARHRGIKKYAEGGKIKGVEVPGKQIIQEAEAENDGFKKGGMIAGGKKFSGGGFAKPPRKWAGGPPGGMPTQAMGAPGGMPPRPVLPPQANPAAAGAPPFLKKGGSTKPVRLASGGSPYSAAAKGGKDAPDKGGECS